jgi:hypothetical protein
MRRACQRPAGREPFITIIRYIDGAFDTTSMTGAGARSSPSRTIAGMMARPGPRPDRNPLGSGRSVDHRQDVPFKGPWLVGPRSDSPLSGCSGHRHAFAAGAAMPSGRSIRPLRQWPVLRLLRLKAIGPCHSVLRNGRCLRRRASRQRTQLARDRSRSFDPNRGADGLRHALTPAIRGPVFRTDVPFQVPKRSVTQQNVTRTYRAARERAAGRAALTDGPVEPGSRAKPAARRHAGHFA